MANAPVNPTTGSTVRPPERLNTNHRAIAALEAAGFGTVAIAETLDLSPNWVSTVKRSPLYQALLAVEQKRLATRTDALFSKLTAHASRAIDRKVELMEQDTNLAVANSACDAILDRVLPKRPTADPSNFQLRITVEERTRLDQVLAEDMAIDVTPLDAVPDATPAADDDAASA